MKKIQLTDSEDEQLVKSRSSEPEPDSDSDVKPVTRKGKGKARAISSDEDDYSVKAEEEEDVDMDGEPGSDEDEGVKKARALARKLKTTLADSSKSKGKGKAVDAEKVGKSVTRLLKGKGKAVESSGGSSTAAFDDGRRPSKKVVDSRTAKGKGRSRSTTASRLSTAALPTDSEDDSDVSDFAPGDDDDDEEEEDGSVYDGEDGDVSMDDASVTGSEVGTASVDLESEDDLKPKKKAKSKVKDEEDLLDELDALDALADAAEDAKTTAKKARKVVPVRKGAVVTKEDKKALKKMSNVRIPSTACAELQLLTLYLLQFGKTSFYLQANHPELKTCWDELRELPVRTVEKAIQPAGLTQKLLPFQLEGLNWLVKQEQGPFKGGFLCDEMG